MVFPHTCGDKFLLLQCGMLAPRQPDKTRTAVSYLYITSKNMSRGRACLPSQFARGKYVSQIGERSAGSDAGKALLVTKRGTMSRKRSRGCHIYANLSWFGDRMRDWRDSIIIKPCSLLERLPCLYPGPPRSEMQMCAPTPAPVQVWSTMASSMSNLLEVFAMSAYSMREGLLRPWRSLASVAANC